MKNILRKIFVVCLISMLGIVHASAVSLIDDTEIETVITELITPLGTAAGIAPNRLKVHIVNQDDFNAFVMGGEDVYIYTGLLTRIKTPNALRAVVAHEMGHMMGGHMVQLSARMESEMTRTMIIQALGLGLVAAGGNASMGAGLMAGASGIAKQSLMAFSRDEERIADDMGVDLMMRANLNPDGFIEVFTQMNEMTSHIESKINPNAVNHPLTAERLKNVREKLSKIDLKKYKSDNADTEKKYDLVRAKLVGYLDSPSRIKSLYPSSDKSDAAIYARAIANMRGGNFDGAMIGTRTLISRNLTNPYFYELLGDLEYKKGNYDAAISAYEKALNMLPNAPQIETSLALVLIERNHDDDRTRAITLCKSAILQNPAPLSYWALARAYGEQDGRSDWAMAEYYNLQKQPKKAKEYARRAKQKLKPGTPEYIKSDDILAHKD